MMAEWTKCPVCQGATSNGGMCTPCQISAERDRLAAEVAELRKRVTELEIFCGTCLSQPSDGKGCSHLRRDLAAANATLDKLREEFGNFNCNETCEECGAVSRHENARLFRIWKLLNPTPTPEKESLRDKAARLGFDEMPADLGQRNLDGETNYVALPPETPNAT